MLVVLLLYIFISELCLFPLMSDVFHYFVLKLYELRVLLIQGLMKFFQWYSKNKYILHFVMEAAFFSTALSEISIGTCSESPVSHSGFTSFIALPAPERHNQL